MSNKDRDSKCLDLALKHIEMLENEKIEIENKETGSVFELYKKNEIIKRMLENENFLNDCKKQYESIKLTRGNDKAFSEADQMKELLEFASKWPNYEL